MRVEVGKRYVRRDSSVTPPLTYINGGTILECPETGYIYDTTSDNGNLVVAVLEHYADLMEEFKDG